MIPTDEQFQRIADVAHAAADAVVGPRPPEPETVSVNFIPLGDDTPILGVLWPTSILPLPDVLPCWYIGRRSERRPTFFRLRKAHWSDRVWLYDEMLDEEAIAVGTVYSEEFERVWREELEKVRAVDGEAKP